MVAQMAQNAIFIFRESFWYPDKLLDSGSFLYPKEFLNPWQFLH